MLICSHSGGPLERGLAQTIRDVLMGSLLVQANDKTTEPLLLHAMLPFCIQDRKEAQDTWVFLLDAQVGHTLFLRPLCCSRRSGIDWDRRICFHGDSCASRSRRPTESHYFCHLCCRAGRGYICPPAGVPEDQDRLRRRGRGHERSFVGHGPR